MTARYSSKRAIGAIYNLIPLFSIAYFLVVGVAATDKAGTTYLETKSSKSDVVTLPSGLLYKVLKNGKGAFHPTVDSPCSCHYAGTLIDGTEFDSSYSRGEPTTFAPNQVIKGWTEAMQLMVEGDKWELYIPSDLAYGQRGSPPQIPADSALVFTLEMIKIKGGKTAAAAGAGTVGKSKSSPLSSVVKLSAVAACVWVLFRLRQKNAIRSR